MAGNREDRRVRKTQALLRQALTGLLQEKGVKDISVTELTRRADVNRGTFYCHYKDIYDMVEQVEGELFSEFNAVMNAYDTNALRGGLGPILNDIFRFVDRNAELCGALLRADGDNSFFQRLKDVVYAKGLREWGELYGFRDAPYGDECISFLVAGTVGLVQAWVSRARRQAPEEMAALTEALILNGIRNLRQ